MADNWLTRRPIQYIEGTKVPLGELPEHVKLQYASEFTAEQSRKHIADIEDTIRRQQGHWVSSWHEDYHRLLLQWWKDHLKNVEAALANSQINKLISWNLNT